MVYYLTHVIASALSMRKTKLVVDFLLQWIFWRGSKVRASKKCLTPTAGKKVLGSIFEQSPRFLRSVPFSLSAFAFDVGYFDLGLFRLLSRLWLMLQLLLQSWKETASLRKSRIKSVRNNDKKYKNDIPNRDWEAFVRRTAWWSTLRMLGREREKCPGVYSSSDDRTRLTYWMFMHTSYIGSKVGGSGWRICC